MTDKRINKLDSSLQHCDSMPYNLDSSLVSLAQNDDNLAQIYYDLYGRRKDKYTFLQGNGLDLVAWSELAPKAPFYLFIPQNESLREEYEKGISVKDMFKVSSVGIVAGKDSVLIATNEQNLET